MVTGRSCRGGLATEVPSRYRDTTRCRDALAWPGRKDEEPMVLGHVEANPHGGSLAVLVRLGPLLPLALIATWAVLVRVRRCDRAGSLATGSALAIGAAGAIHLALGPAHLREGVGPGLFFVAAGVAQ